MRNLGRIKRTIESFRMHLKPTSVDGRSPNASYFREIANERKQEFHRKGYKERHFFPHRFYYLPKCGPDGYKLAYRMCDLSDPNQMWEIVLYAISPQIDEFPTQLFFDDDLVWHQQQFGKVGQIATVDLAVDKNKLYTMAHVADIVQRISRRRTHKTRIEKVFQGWHHLLLNCIMNFALEQNIKKVYSPTSEWALQHTDPARTVQKELFERIYDRAVIHHFRARRENLWWITDVAENRDRIVIPTKKYELVGNTKTICLCHDIERGIGHKGIDPGLAELAERTSLQHLEHMLDIEREMNVKATYNVLGCLFGQVREKIEDQGHCVAFHSYDHNLELDQLHRCREVDYRVKGYRPPQSKLTRELNDRNLCFHNFEWFANSVSSLGISRPTIQNRLVKIPLFFDDFALYKHGIAYEDWERMAFDTISRNDFVAFSLHDCYGAYWLPHYRDFITKIKDLGQLKSLNEVTNELLISSAI